MPAWGDLLNNEEIRAVVAHIKTLSPMFQRQASQPIATPPRVPPDSASLARGRAQFAGQCANCHGPDGRAGLLLKDSKGYPVIARDVTAPWTFHGGSAPDEIWLRLTTGLLPGPMPSFADTLTAADRWDVVNYVLSIARNPPWESGGRLGGPGQHSNPVARGRYFIHAMMCGLCHAPINRTGIYRGDDFYLAGGMRVGAYPHEWLISRNLTSDGATGLGSWTEAEIMEAFQQRALARADAQPF